MILAASHCAISIPATPSRNPSKRNYVLSKLNRLSDFNNLEATSKAHEGKMRRTCECFDLYKELVPYGEAWAWQKSIVKEKKALIEEKKDYSDTVIILQHRPVYTLGTASSEEFLNFDMKDAPYDVYRTERGGEVTYHGPGQLVLYPIINLRYHKMDLHWYLRELEEVVIRVLFSTFSIKASRLEGFTGVWVGDQKLAAIGIVPCGIRNRHVGSIKGLLGESLLSTRCGTADTLHTGDCQLIDITHNSLINEFSEVFQLEVHHKPISTIEFLKEEATSSHLGKINI